LEKLYEVLTSGNRPLVQTTNKSLALGGDFGKASHRTNVATPATDPPESSPKNSVGGHQEGEANTRRGGKGKVFWGKQKTKNLYDNSPFGLGCCSGRSEFTRVT